MAGKAGPIASAVVGIAGTVVAATHGQVPSTNVGMYFANARGQSTSQAIQAGTNASTAVTTSQPK